MDEAKNALTRLKSVAAVLEKAVRPDEALNEILKIELPTLLADAEELPFAPATPDAPWRRVRVLGKNANEKESGGGMVPGAAATLFASRGKQFSICYCISEAGKPGDILIQADNAKCDEALLSGVFGVASLEDVRAPREYDSYNTRYCTCAYAFHDREACEKPLDKEADWLTCAAQALTGWDHCAVWFRFAPLDAAWIDNMIDRLTNEIDDLSSKLKCAIQYNASVNYKINVEDEKTGILGSLGKYTRGTKDNIIGKSTELIPLLPENSESASRTFEQENSAVNRVHEELKHRLEWLDCMRRMGGWTLSVTVGSDNHEAREVLQNIAESALLRQGYRRDKWLIPSSNNARRVSALIPVNRLGAFFAFPETDLPGFKRLPLPDYEVNLSTSEGEGFSCALGHAIWNEKELASQIVIPHKEMNRHVFICGMTGSGKTNTVCTLLQNSSKELPFMVIEPVKGEYRSLAGSVKDLRVYTMEAGTQALLSTNPFWFPAGGSPQYHIDSLRSIIASAFELTAAMPNILEQCLTRVYVKLGWNIATGKNIYTGKLRQELLYPNFSMLCSEIKSYLADAGFAAEVKSNYEGALLARLQSFTYGTKGLLFDQQVIPQFKSWIDNKNSVVIELEALADDADKAILMGVLLIQYFQCVKSRSSTASDGLRHIIVLEEAHHLFKESENGASHEGPDTRKHLVELLSNMLAEIRAYGESIFIVDQSPTSISSQVIKNTAVKIIHRVDYIDDLRVLQHALLLEDADMRAPSRLECGKALLRVGSMRKPIHVAVPKCDAKEAAVLGGRYKAGINGIDVQYILDLLQVNLAELNRMRTNCGKFLDHLLFCNLKDTRRALEILQDRIHRILINVGVDETILRRMTVEDKKHILKSFVVGSLSEACPLPAMGGALTVKSQLPALLRGKIQMLSERFLALELSRESGIRANEWTLIDAYRSSELIGSIAVLNQNSSDEELRKLTRQFFSSTRMAMCGVLRHMVKNYEDSEATSSEKHTKEYYRNSTGLSLLCKDDFLFFPPSAAILWEMFSMDTI